jgi:membrane-bound serine protease (ClpP class)
MDLILSVFALLVAAVICIWLEFVVPSHGILAIFFLLLCMVALVISAFVSMDFAALTVIILLVMIPTAGWCGFRYYPNSPIARRIFLHKPAPTSLPANELRYFINKTGVAESVLRPSGVCTIEQQRFACVSESAQIEAGVKIRVIGISGNYLIVAPLV